MSMDHLIVAVDPGSIGEELGITKGCRLLSIDEEEIHDIIDYEQLTTGESISMRFAEPDGTIVEAEIDKELYEPLGLTFQHGGLMSPIRSCKNHCIFCFIDQMPKGVRSSLHVKDDDWRLSLIMGNYVTLTNVDDSEFDRMLKRHAGPLYISAHATDGAVRQRMMNNPSAGKLMERLIRLKEAGLAFHAQVVLCPGINDEAILDRTISDLLDLYPAAGTLAVVPVGLTKFRDRLHPLVGVSPEGAAAVVEQIEKWQGIARIRTGSAFVFASDELYILAGKELPPAETYEDYLQIENGVGLLRKFESEFLYALSEQEKVKSIVLDSATGMSAAPFMRRLFEKLKPYGIEIETHAVANHYFGESVTVSGLVTAADLAEQLINTMKSDILLIPRTMLKENDTVFLDGTDLKDLSRGMGKRIVPMSADDGEAFVKELFELCKEV